MSLLFNFTSLQRPFPSARVRAYILGYAAVDNNHKIPMAQCSRGRYPVTDPNACHRPTGQGLLQQPSDTGWLMEWPPSPTLPVTITERKEASSQRTSQWSQHPGAGSDTLYLTGQTQSGSTVLSSTFDGGNLTTWRQSPVITTPLSTQTHAHTPVHISMCAQTLLLCTYCQCQYLHYFCIL